ncbi:hypothetical protein ANN_25164 [Periplaneta americana]|uniref:Uncharacterized protein n=1 Tax=Periplaneta americana TaxID=6978 RepID=A0ABQ8S0R3_PERAM|nr:hypothetical protein ANN_25164 [Periplaneta americana]
MAGLCEGDNEPSGSLKAICNKSSAVNNAMTTLHFGAMALTHKPQTVCHRDAFGGELTASLHPAERAWDGGLISDERDLLTSMFVSWRN